MNIGGTSGVGGPQRIFPSTPQGEKLQADSAKPAVQGDQVEISAAARLRDAISRIPDIRAEKVAEAKRLIASGELDTPANLDVAIGRMLDDALGA